MPVAGGAGSIDLSALVDRKIQIICFLEPGSRWLPCRDASHGYYYFGSDGTETFIYRPDRPLHIRVHGRPNSAYARCRGSVEGQVRWDGDVLILPWGAVKARFKRFLISATQPLFPLSPVYSKYELTI